MSHALAVLVWTYMALVVALSLWVATEGLWALLCDRITRTALADERSRHAAELAARLEAQRKEHQESAEWLLQLNRESLYWLKRRHQEELDRAVADALTNVAPHPLRDVA